MTCNITFSTIHASWKVNVNMPVFIIKKILDVNMPFLEDIKSNVSLLN